MSKNSRKKKKNSRDAMKHKRRESNRARYAAMRDQGDNFKSTRAQSNKVKNRKVRPFKKKQRTEVRMSAGAPFFGMTLAMARNQMSIKKFLKYLKEHPESVTHAKTHTHVRSVVR